MTSLKDSGWGKMCETNLRFLAFSGLFNVIKTNIMGFKGIVHI